MDKKYVFTDETAQAFGRTLHRIKALINFGYVVAGELGGFIEKEDNLAQNGDAWVSGNAKIYGNAKVYDNAWVGDDAMVGDDAEVYGDAAVYGDAEVYGNARVSGDAEVCGNARVSGDAEVCGNADYLCFKGLGSENRNTTFFKCKDGHIRVSCGCFSGTRSEFEDKVKATHGDSKYAKEYLSCIEVVKIHFDIDG